MTPPRTPPEHTHLPEYEGIAPGCPRCMAEGLTNPDTGTPWAPLGRHGEQVVQDTVARFFNDHYDGSNAEEALTSAAEEAYLRGVMHGRQEERRALARSSAGELSEMVSHLRVALDAAEKGDTALAVNRTGSAAHHGRAAAVLHRAAGPQA